MEDNKVFLRKFMKLYHAKLMRNDRPVAETIYSAYFDTAAEAIKELSEVCCAKGLWYHFSKGFWVASINGSGYFGFVQTIDLEE